MHAISDLLGCVVILAVLALMAIGLGASGSTHDDEEERECHSRTIDDTCPNCGWQLPCNCNQNDADHHRHHSDWDHHCHHQQDDWSYQCDPYPTDD